MNSYRIIILLLVLASAAISIVMYVKQDAGVILVSFAEYQYQTSLLIFSAVCVAVIFSLFLLYQFFSKLNKWFAFFGLRRKNRLANKAYHSLSQGLIEMAEGRFAKAEKILLQQAEHNENVLLAYLAAARAAQHQGAHDRRDEYLRLAHQHTPTADVAIGLTKAELQLEHNQLEQALATLSHLRELSAGHNYVLKLLVITYQHLSDWNELKNLLPSVNKQNLFPQEQLLVIEKTTWCGLLTDNADFGTEALAAIWKDAPHHIKTLPDVVEHYARVLINIEANDAAEKILRNSINHNWCESTIELYSDLDVVVDNKVLEMVASWLNAHQHNAPLLLALGKLCMGLNLWGKARNYFEASIAVKPMTEAYRKLALLLEEHMDEPELALENYKLGMQLLADENERIPPAPVIETEGPQSHNKPDLKIV